MPMNTVRIIIINLPLFFVLLPKLALGGLRAEITLLLLLIKILMALLIPRVKIIGN